MTLVAKSAIEITFLSPEKKGSNKAVFEEGKREGKGMLN